MVTSTYTIDGNTSFRIMRDMHGTALLLHVTEHGEWSFEYDYSSPFVPDNLVIATGYITENGAEAYVNPHVEGDIT